MDARPYDPDADAKIVGWRMGCFMRLGIPELHASALAVRRDIDRVVVERMVAGGCPPHTLLEVLL